MNNGFDLNFYLINTLQCCFILKKDLSILFYTLELCSKYSECEENQKLEIFKNVFNSLYELSENHHLFS